MLEKNITKKIKNWLKLQGYLVIKIAGGRFQSPGISDIIACAPNGRFLAIEVKVPGKRATPLQASFLGQIRAHNGLSLEAHSVEEVKDCLGNDVETANIDDLSHRNEGIKFDLTGWVKRGMLKDFDMI